MVDNSSLKRELGLLDAVGIGVGAVFGAGLFVVSGVAANVAGPSFLIGLVIAAFVATCNGLSSAQLASIYPQSGGTYEYGYRLLTKRLGFSAGWMFLVSKLSAGGVVAIGFGNYLYQIFPLIPPKIAAIIAICILTFANYQGIKKAGKLNLIIISITLFSLLYFIISGIPSFDSSNLTPFAKNGVVGVLNSAALLFFAFTGYARITTIGEEVKNPKKTIPLAIIFTLVISSVFYLLTSLIAVGGIGSEQLGLSTSPLITAASHFNTFGTVFMISIGATTAMLGVLLSQILGISRMMFAMAKRRDLPSTLSKIHPSHNVPHFGIVLSGVIILLLAIFGSLKFIVSSATFSILLYYSIANTAALKVKNEERFIPRWVSILGLISCLLLAVSLDIQTIISGVALLIIGLVYQHLYHYLLASQNKN